jgi:hypothetical protein
VKRRPAAHVFENDVWSVQGDQVVDLAGGPSLGPSDDIVVRALVSKLYIKVPPLQRCRLLELNSRVSVGDAPATT